MTRLHILPLAMVSIAGILLLCAAQTEIDPGVQLQWNDKGLTSIRYAHHEYLSFGQMAVSRLELTDSNGSPHLAPAQSTSEVNPKTGTVASLFSWGSIQTKLTAKGNVLTMTIAIANTSAYRIAGLAIEPLRLRFDQKPAEYDGSIPIIADNITKPAVLVLSTPDESLILANEDPTRPLSIGFPWAVNKPISTEFPIRIMTGREPMYPDRTPPIQRPIAPGQTDVYRLSLTFGGSRQTANGLSATIYRRLAALYPSVIHWTDRRPIGAIMLATADAGFPNNPRGWFLDRSLDVFSDRGAARFRGTLMRWADRSIDILRQMNAQGAITWDIEGEQYPHPSTYVGDPRLIEALDPEMSSCVDAYFKRFRDAGFRVGLTIRPQQFIRASDGRSATQQEVADPVQLLNDKIRYAKQRWNATIFYVDSNGDPNFPMDANVLRTVSLDNPGVLLIPEHSSLFYYAFSAPYGELRRGVTATPSLALSIYPSAFRVINTADGPISANLQNLRNAVNNGDVLMFRTWFDDPANALVQAVTRDISKSGG